MKRISIGSGGQTAHADAHSGRVIGRRAADAGWLPASGAALSYADECSEFCIADESIAQDQSSVADELLMLVVDELGICRSELAR
jgi:hypothetical protein